MRSSVQDKAVTLRLTMLDEPNKKRFLVKVLINFFREWNNCLLTISIVHKVKSNHAKVSESEHFSLCVVWPIRRPSPMRIQIRNEVKTRIRPQGQGHPSHGCQCCTRSSRMRASTMNKAIHYEAANVSTNCVLFPSKSP